MFKLMHFYIALLLLVVFTAGGANGQIADLQVRLIPSATKVKPGQIVSLKFAAVNPRAKRSPVTLVAEAEWTDSTGTTFTSEASTTLNPIDPIAVNHVKLPLGTSWRVVDGSATFDGAPVSVSVVDGVTVFSIGKELMEQQVGVLAFDLKFTK